MGIPRSSSEWDSFWNSNCIYIYIYIYIYKRSGLFLAHFFRVISPSPVSGHRVGMVHIGIHALKSAPGGEKQGRARVSGGLSNFFLLDGLLQGGGCFVVSLLYLHVLAAQVKAVRGRSAADGEKLQHVTGLV